MNHRLSPLQASTSHDDLFELCLPIQSKAILPASTVSYSSSSTAVAISRTSSLSSDSGKFHVGAADRFSWESDICTSSCRSSSGTSQDCCNFLEGGDDCITSSSKKLPQSSSSLQWSRSFSFRLYSPRNPSSVNHSKPFIKRFLFLSLRLPRRLFCKQGNNIEVAASQPSTASKLKQGRRRSVDSCSSNSGSGSSNGTPAGVSSRGFDSCKTGHASSASSERVRQDELKSAIAHCKQSAALPL